MIPTVPAWSDVTALAKGAAFPELTLPQPKSETAAAYLGIDHAAKTFPLAGIKAKVLIIEAFSMYCPYCQKEAPLVNKLYELFQGLDLAEKVKIIGLGVGNSDYEIQVFREKYAIAFPLFPDKSFAIHKLLGEVRTPYFWVLRLDGQGGSRVVYSKLGGITDVAGFLKLIRQELGLK
ncbi:MAG: TlpA family protein disulfide reductase [Deltaproteobacteria bacterium]|nr:TlpA family protein disulfide reductase [Deltaproteobacteria bacterium]MBF0524933.1 TlpA family protein disulfide reductase [Deltaproteobacteria bacterium]